MARRLDSSAFAKATSLASPLAFLLAVAGAAEVSVRMLAIPAVILPPPSQILARAVSDFPALGYACFVTMSEAFGGFCAANFVAFSIALVFAYSPRAERAVLPIAIALKTTPIVALAPVLVLWFGTGYASKAVAAGVICFFPMLVNATRGLRRVDEAALDLFRSLGATRAQVLWKLRIPTAAPYIFSALKISSSLSVVGAIVGEFVGAAEGLGFTILVASYRLETDLMLAAVLCSAVMGVLFFAAVAVVEKFFVGWATSDTPVV